MPRQVATTILCALTLSIPMWSSAQAIRPAPVLVGRQAGALGGQLRGMVRDEAGRAVTGASVVALGAAPVPVQARSDTAGQFLLSLPPGDYILRATRDGYVSTYREPVRIQSSTLLERNITLVRMGATVPGPILLAGTGPAEIPVLREEPAVPDGKEEDHPHNETAWRLRHLPPTALRDVAAAAALPDSQTSNFFRPRTSIVDWVMGQPARAATSFFSNTDFTGQLNFLTSSALAPGSGSWVPTELPHSVAYAALGAPVGTSGDWKLRGGMSAGMSSWAVVGEYAARDDSAHAFSMGLSFSSQLSENGSDVAPTAVNDRARSVGGLYGFDRWQIQPALELSYGLRFDRYDYVTGSEFLSPQIGFRVLVLPGTHLMVNASQQTFAPGADEFLPPPGGPWLPPERTFAPLLPTGSFHAERVRNYEVGIDQQLWRGGMAPTVGLRRFQQSASDQVATLFGLDSGTGEGQYYVATPGSVRIDGWIVRATARVSPNVGGTITYSTGDADWAPGAESMTIVGVASSVVRVGSERLHDVTTSIDANIPETATKVRVGYRLNSAFSQPNPDGRTPVMRGRFDLELRQPLGLKPTAGGNTE